jgi:cytochrome oxidase Cu insertion factor (SCO1/SenC/PrrC family)
MANNYEMNEQDIDATIRYLKTIDPENATPEMAIEYLEKLQAGFHTLAHTKPELLKKIYKDLIAKKRPTT